MSSVVRGMTFMTTFQYSIHLLVLWRWLAYAFAVWIHKARKEVWIRSHCCRILNSDIMDICWTRSYPLGYWSVQRFCQNTRLPLSAFVCYLATTSLSFWNFCCSTISNQLVAGSIIVRHIKSILEPSLPLRVYEPMRSTHNASQGVVMTSFVEHARTYAVSLINLARFARFDLWLDGTLHTFPIHHGVSLSLQDVSAQGAGGSGDTNWPPCAVEMLEWPFCLPCKALWCLQ